MQRVIVSKEEVEADLDRVRVEIVSTPIGVNSSNLGTICHKYVNGLRKFKFKFKPEKYTIDEHATKIIGKDGISFQNNLQPVRYELGRVFLFQYKYLS